MQLFMFTWSKSVHSSLPTGLH